MHAPSIVPSSLDVRCRSSWRKVCESACLCSCVFWFVLGVRSPPRGGVVERNTASGGRAEPRRPQSRPVGPACQASVGSGSNQSSTMSWVSSIPIMSNDFMMNTSGTCRPALAASAAAQLLIRKGGCCALWQCCLVFLFHWVSSRGAWRRFHHYFCARRRRHDRLPNGRRWHHHLAHHPCRCRHHRWSHLHRPLREAHRRPRRRRHYQALHHRCRRCRL